MIILDASVLIGQLDGHDPHHKRARALLERSGTEPLGASAITLAETLVGPARAGRLEEANAALAQLGVRELALGEGAPARLAQLRADTGLKLPDCCVLAATQRFQGAVTSFDAELLGAAGGLDLETLGSERKSS